MNKVIFWIFNVTVFAFLVSEFTRGLSTYLESKGIYIYNWFYYMLSTLFGGSWWTWSIVFILSLIIFNFHEILLKKLEFLVIFNINSKKAKNIEEYSRFDFNSLSVRESTIMMMIAQGMGIKEIAEKLQLNTKTINNYRYRILEKLNLKNDCQIALLVNQHSPSKFKLS